MKKIATIMLLGVLFAGVLKAGSDTPPEGPEWQRDILKATELALDEDKPIFVYFTKTY